MKNSFKLHFAEYFLVILFAATLLGLSAYSLSHQEEATMKTYSGLDWQQDKLVDVTIEGAVENPGTYQVRVGTTVKEILDLAILKPDSDLSRIALKKSVTRRLKLKIPLTSARIKKERSKRL